MIRYGILSTASIVPRFVAGIRESREGHVQAIASRTIEKAQEFAAQLEIENYYGSYQELFKDPNVDIVYVPTVNGFHYRDALAALMHGKHVVVEKPFALTRSQAVELFDLAKEKKLFLMETQKSVFLPVTRKVKELIDEGAIGDIKYAEFKAGFPGRFSYDHWMYDLSLGGGALYGSATYTIEYIQYLFDRPQLKIDGTGIKCPTGADEICNFQLVVNDSALVSSTIAMNVPLNNEAVFYGEKGQIRVPNYWKSCQLELTMYDGTSTHFDFPFDSEFVYEIDHINDCLNKHLIQSDVMTAARTIETIELVASLYKKWNGM